MPRVEIPDDELKKRLTPEQYHVTRERGTEAPFSGKYVHTKNKGMYNCVNCGARLFSSDTKFDSNSGWPGFYEPANREAVELVPDNSHGTQRTEIVCKNCGAHLGHIFDDAPDQPTGKRFCINSCALEFEISK